MSDAVRIEPEEVGYLSEALAVLQRACREAGVPFFVVGAAARDILLEHVHEVPPFRRTGDVDIAVAVASWAEYEGLIGRLVRGYGFQKGREAQRVTRRGLIVDMVPFGALADEGREVEWPGRGQSMSVLGYPEAFDAAVAVRISDGAPFRVASLPGNVVLKLVAWGENPHQRKKDPIDICAIMMGYEHAVGDRLYTEHNDLLEGIDEVRVACARILGRDIAALLVEPTLRARVLDLVRSNTEDEYDSPLVQAMGMECHSDFVFRLRCFRAVRRGVEERAETEDA